MNKKAFTLIELLIVIGIIAILASAVIVAINPGQQFAAARDATREQHINSLQNSLLSYQISNQGWGDLDITDELTEICNTNEVNTEDCGDLADISDLVDDEHINQIPVDPQAEGDGTGYEVAEGSIILAAPLAETRFIGVGITEDEYSEGGSDGEAFTCGESFTDDRDGQTYETVEIDDQCWFAEDLRYECENYEAAGDSEPDYWDGEVDACADANDGNNDYGNLLYQWEAAMDGSTTEGAQGLCPDGWHVPTDNEWTTLEDWLTNNGYEDEEGDALKDPTEDWCDSDTCGGTGFLALPGGLRDTSGSLSAIGVYEYWWSSTEDGSDDAWGRRLLSSDSGVHRLTDSRALGYSVRCLKD